MTSVTASAPADLDSGPLLTSWRRNCTGYSLSPIGLSIADGLSFAEWASLGQRLLRFSDAAAWWIGDWLVYGEWRYGEKYRTIVDRLQLSYDRVRDYAYVAGNVSPGVRREDVSFTHHRLIAKLPPKEQERWLARAAERRWTKRELADALAARLGKPARQPAIELRLTIDPDRLERLSAAATQAGLDMKDWVRDTLDRTLGAPGSDAAPKRHLVEAPKEAGVEPAWYRDSLAAVHDASSRRRVESLGVERGWSCLEIGAGCGSIARWLADRVAPEGRVLATDVDPRQIGRLRRSAGANLEVRRHDVGRDPLPEASFDLVYARCVLLFVPDFESAVASLISALKPGGWIVLEEFDVTLIGSRSWPIADPVVRARFDRVKEATRAVLREQDTKLDLGRHLHRLLTGGGLAYVHLEEIGRAHV